MSRTDDAVEPVVELEPPELGFDHPSMIERGQLRLLFLPHLLAMVAGLLVALIPNPGFALETLALISVGYGLFIVGTWGRSYLTPSGVFFLASGVFVGLAAHYLNQVGSINEPSELRDWAVVAFVVTVATAMVTTMFNLKHRIWWPSNAELRVAERHTVPVSPPDFFLYAILLVAMSQVPMVQGLNRTIANAAGVCGVMMLVLIGSSRRVKMRWHGDVLLVAMVVIVPLVWIQLEFEGGGRLTLAGLGIASLLAWNIVRPRRIQKIAVVCAIPVFLIFSGLNRLEHNGQDAGSRNILSSGDGLESMYGPLDTWTELVTLDPDQQARDGAASAGPRWGATFLNTFLIPVPRSYWSNKPKGFGAELTRILRAKLLREERISPEHSMAALIHGEFYVNFGIPGLFLLPLVVGWFLSVLDRARWRLARSGLAGVDDWWKATILACLVGSLGDLFWVGTFTFVARGGMAALVAWVMWRFTTRRRAPVASPGA